MRYAIIALAIATSLAGCGAGKPETTVLTTPDGATVKTNGNTSTITDNKGNTAVTTTNKDGTTDISGTTSDGESYSMSSKKTIDFKEFGLKEYPSTLPGDELNRTNVIESDRGKTVSVLFTTKDSIEKVTDFYQPQLIEKNSSVTKTGEGTIMGGETSTGAKIAIIISKVENATQVSISGGIEKAK